MADDETECSETSSRTMSKLQDSGDDSGDTGQKNSKHLLRDLQMSLSEDLSVSEMAYREEMIPHFLRMRQDKEEMITHFLRMRQNKEEMWEPLHVINLKKNRLFLMRNLDVGPLVAALRKEGILSRSEHDLLHREGSTRLQQCKLFLDILERKDEKAYDTLKDILDDTQPHIRKQLDKTSAEDGRQDLIESFPHKYMTKDELQLRQMIRHLIFENQTLRKQLDKHETARKTKDEPLEQLEEKETLTNQRLVIAEILQSELERECNALRKENQILKEQLVAMLETKKELLKQFEKKGTLTTQRVVRLAKADDRQTELEDECNALRKENQALKTQVATQRNYLVDMEETVRKTKEFRLEQLEERKTLITQQIAGTEQATDLFQPSGEIVLSFSESEHEAQIFETLTQNKANMLKLFAEYGMRLDDIEQGSIHFKFSIPVGDDKIPVFQEASMKTIIAEICQGALNTLPGGKTEDIHFDFEFTPLKNVHYHIEANSVQLGDHNEMKMESTEFPSARITSSESEPSVTEVQRQSDPETPSETLYAAKIKFAAPGSEAAEAIMTELSNLKQVSYLDIEFERKQLNKVKLQIQRKEKSWEDFFTSVKKFMNFPHLKRVIETHTVDVHVEMPFDDIQLTNPVKTNALQVGISNKMTMESAVPPNASTATSESRSGLDVTEALPESDLQNPVKAEHPELGRSNKMTMESAVPPNATTATSESRSGLGVTETLPDSDLQNRMKSNSSQWGNKSHKQIEPPAHTVSPFSNSSQESRLLFGLHKVHL